MKVINLLTCFDAQFGSTTKDQLRIPKVRHTGRKAATETRSTYGFVPRISDHLWIHLHDVSVLIAC